MTQHIFKNGQDQYLMIPRLLSVTNSTGDQTPVFGTSDGQLLSSIFSNLSVNWWVCTQNEDVSITQNVTWNGNIGMWKVKIPSDSVDTGTGWITVLGQTEDGTESIIPTSVEVEVHTKTPSKKIVPPQYYQIYPDQNQIHFFAPYNTLNPEQILSIIDLDKHIDIYNSREPKRHICTKSYNAQGFDIGIENSILTYIENPYIDENDHIQIIINADI